MLHTFHCIPLYRMGPTFEEPMVPPFWNELQGADGVIVKRLTTAVAQSCGVPLKLAGSGARERLNETGAGIFESIGC